MAHLSPQEFLNRLAELGIEAETVEHEPVFTVAESRPVKARIPGAHSKNLFVKDKKGRLFLITARDETGGPQLGPPAPAPQSPRGWLLGDRNRARSPQQKLAPADARASERHVRYRIAG